MTYLRELIERLGNALRMKPAPVRTPEASTSTPPLGPIEGPAGQARP